MTYSDGPGTARTVPLSALSLSFAEAFERHHDLIRLHPAAAFEVDKRERDDAFLIDDIGRRRAPVPGG